MARTTEAIAGFYRTREQGEAAREALLGAGFTTEQVGFVAGDTRGHTTPKIGPLDSVGAEDETTRDALFGGMAGLALGMVAVVIPGIGPLIAAGPLAGTIAGAIGGATVGATAGGIIGMLKDHGVSEEEAEFYAEGVKRGGALVTVHGVSDDRATEAKRILERHGAIDTESLDD
jgi:hypothetical protein